MSNLKRLLEQAKANSKNETTAFDELEDEIQNLAVNSMPINQNIGLSKDGQVLEVGDPVVGIHNGYKLAGQVIATDGDKITVLWRDKSQSIEKSNTLTMTDVDTDYEEQTMYLESYAPSQTMGFDKESFNEDADLDSLLHGSSNGSNESKYNLRGDL